MANICQYAGYHPFRLVNITYIVAPHNVLQNNGVVCIREVEIAGFGIVCNVGEERYTYKLGIDDELD